MNDDMYISTHSQHFLPIQESASTSVGTVKVLVVETGSQVNKCLSATEVK